MSKWYKDRDFNEIKRVRFNEPNEIIGFVEDLKSLDRLIQFHNEEMEGVENELQDYKNLHRRTVELVIPGERDSPGAYRKLLKDAEDERDKLVEALKIIAKHKGMTQLWNCCVNKMCTPAYDDGKKVAHCLFSYGVNRAFNECAWGAEEALAEIEKK